MPRARCNFFPIIKISLDQNYNSEHTCDRAESVILTWFAHQTVLAADHGKHLITSCHFDSIQFPKLYSCVRVVCKCSFQILRPITVKLEELDKKAKYSTLIRLSLLPETIRDLYGCQLTHLTSQPCPVNTFSSLHLPKSQILSVTSSEHDTNFASVGEKL